MPRLTDFQRRVGEQRVREIDLEEKIEMSEFLAAMTAGQKISKRYTWTSDEGAKYRYSIGAKVSIEGKLSGWTEITNPDGSKSTWVYDDRVSEVYATPWNIMCNIADDKLSHKKLLAAVRKAQQN